MKQVVIKEILTSIIYLDDNVNLNEYIEELKSGKFANVAERSGRAQDKEGGGLEELRKGGYM